MFLYLKQRSVVLIAVISRVQSDHLDQLGYRLSLMIGNKIRSTEAIYLQFLLCKRGNPLKLLILCRLF